VPTRISTAYQNLKPGDEILAIEDASSAFRQRAFRQPLAALPWTVMGRVPNPVSGLPEWQATSAMIPSFCISNCPQNLTATYHVKASGELAVGDRIVGIIGILQNKDPWKKNSNYSSTCTRCGRPAYLGAFEVEHEDEVAAAKCPARRK
jgi:hypothetical protein